MKCEDTELGFQVNCLNSDSKCFTDPGREGVVEAWVKARKKALADPNLCTHCVYNLTHKDHTYSSWQDYLKENGVKV